jgi:hypothetical protein
MHLDYIIGNETTGFPGMMRSYLDEPTAEASDWEDDELIMYVNAEHRHLFSVIRGYNEDWFGRTVVFPLVANRYSYFLPMECVNPRRVELISAASVTEIQGSTSGVFNHYDVDENTANPQIVDDIQLADKGSVRTYNSNFGYRFGSGYYLFDDKINFEPNGNIGPTLYCRVYYSPQAPDLHRGVVTAWNGNVNGQTLDPTGFDEIKLASNLALTTLGDVKKINNYYLGMRIQFMSGQNAGLIRRIVMYDAESQFATLDAGLPDDPTDDTYSIVSPVQEDYQELLILGGVMRAKGIKIEDDVSGVGVIYSALMSDMESNLEKRNHQSNRRVQRSTWG